MLCRIIAVITALSRKSSIVNYGAKIGYPPWLDLVRRFGGFPGHLRLGSAISFGVHLLMARLLGARSYGYFVYATSWMAILLLGCNLGLKPTVVDSSRRTRHVASGARSGFAAPLDGMDDRGLRRGYDFVSAIALWVMRPRFRRARHDARAGGVRAAVHGARGRLEFGCARAGSGRAFPVSRSIVQHVLFGIVLIIILFVAGENGGAVSAAAAFLIATIGTMVAASFSPARTAAASADIAAPFFSPSGSTSPPAIF